MESSCFALWVLISTAQIKWRSQRTRVLKLWLYIHMLLWYICYSDSMFFLYLKVLLFIIIFIRKHYYLFRYYFIISFIVIIIKYIIYQFSLFHYCNYLPLFTIVTSYILTLYWVQIWFSFCHCFLPKLYVTIFCLFFKPCFLAFVLSP